MPAVRVNSGTRFCDEVLASRAHRSLSWTLPSVLQGWPHFFDLRGKSFQFQPTGSATYRAVSSSKAFEATGGTNIALTDDDSKLINLDFSFPFYGTSYTSLYVNSDGNLTFVSLDKESIDRNLSFNLKDVRRGRGGINCCPKSLGSNTRKSCSVKNMILPSERCVTPAGSSLS